MERLAKFGIHLQLNADDLPAIDRLHRAGYSYPDIFRAGMQVLEKEKQKTEEEK